MTQHGRERDVPGLGEAELPDVLKWPGKEHEAAAQGAAAQPHAVAGLPQAAEFRELKAADLGRRRRRVFWPVFLFLATCASTFIAGSLNWNPGYYLATGASGRVMNANWQQGLTYMAAVIGILLTHEMGHFVQTLRYHVPASFPFFIPVPFLMTGTMGAVIGMEGSKADRKQLFDIGISGPWAGLIVSLPIIWFGIKHATAAPADGEIVLGDPLIFKLLTHWLRPELDGAVLDKNHPLLMAGWVGMLITGLNMLPISQLDGGHVIYGLFGRRSRLVARGFMVAAILFVVLGEHYNWTLMLVLVILLGVDHPPTRDDSVRLGWGRKAFGLVSLAIPVLCFTPVLL
jgi:membrane-associated protease RseP (regulator of RpoE activity)